MVSVVVVWLECGCVWLELGWSLVWLQRGYSLIRALVTVWLQRGSTLVRVLLQWGWSLVTVVTI